MNHSKNLLIWGSARNDGNTRKMVEMVAQNHEVECINVSDYNISHYDYNHKNSFDDFLNIAEKMSYAETIVFATPVYWYAMSAVMKIFFDRFTDLITIRKDLGRALKGKYCFLLATGTETTMPAGFEIPFFATANYLDMEYKGEFYYYSGKDARLASKAEVKAQQFGNRVFGCESVGERAISPKK